MSRKLRSRLAPRSTVEKVLESNRSAKHDGRDFNKPPDCQTNGNRPPNEGTPGQASKLDLPDL
jgi:hypothetical protein